MCVCSILPLPAEVTEANYPTLRGAASCNFLVGGFLFDPLLLIS